MRQSIEERVGRFTKYFQGITSVQVTASHDHRRNEVRVEFVIHVVRGVVFATADTGSDIDVAVDRAAEKVERRLVRLKEKLKEHRAGKAPAGVQEGSDAADQEFEEVIRNLLEEPQ
jgi:ribosomal subunit interface protein